MTGRDDTLRRGFALLGRAVRHEPRIFAFAVGGSAVYGVMTVGAAWVLGRVTDEVVAPAFKSGARRLAPWSAPHC